MAPCARRGSCQCGAQRRERVRSVSWRWSGGATWVQRRRFVERLKSKLGSQSLGVAVLVWWLGVYRFTLLLCAVCCVRLACTGLVQLQLLSSRLAHVCLCKEFVCMTGATIVNLCKLSLGHGKGPPAHVCQKERDPRASYGSQLGTALCFALPGEPASAEMLQGQVLAVVCALAVAVAPCAGRDQQSHSPSQNATTRLWQRAGLGREDATDGHHGHPDVYAKYLAPLRSHSPHLLELGLGCSAAAETVRWPGLCGAVGGWRRASLPAALAAKPAGQAMAGAYHPASTPSRCAFPWPLQACARGLGASLVVLSKPAAWLRHLAFARRASICCALMASAVCLGTIQARSQCPCLRPAGLYQVSGVRGVPLPPTCQLMLSLLG